MFEAWWLDVKKEQARQETLRRKVRDLPEADRSAYFDALDGRLRDPDTYAVLIWFFLAGLHHFYVQQYLAGTINLAAMLVGLVLLFVLPPAGLILILLIIVVELPALFRSQIIVMHYNTKQGERLMDSMKTKGHQSCRPAR